MTDKAAGQFMASESAEALAVFARAASPDALAAVDPALLVRLAQARAVYTIARGSSDAAANILSYEWMREARVPVTSLPPSVFSLGGGVALAGAAALVVSQSGASQDLVRSAKGARAAGAVVWAIVNQAGSEVAAAADYTVALGAGPEHAVPATKTVIGSIGAGMALLAAVAPEYAARVARDRAVVAGLPADFAGAGELQRALAAARHVYVIGRDTGYGAAHEVALKLKECCALHAEAFSASEVLHGPLQLATKPLLVLILDTQSGAIQGSLDQAEARFKAIGCTVLRVAPRDAGVGARGAGEMAPRDTGLGDLTPAAAAAVLLAMLYPVILRVALDLGFDPDLPAALSKVTQTT